MVDNSKFGFDLSILQVGDVLLSANDTKTSKTIARLTRGDFSHVMLYVGHSIIHAMPDGVYSKNPQRYIRNNARQLAAFRLVPEFLTSAATDVACDFARQQVGALYSVPAAMLSKAIAKVKVNVEFQGDKQFCSRLVAQAFERAGISLVSNADFCSPNDLARSQLLRPVENAVRELTAAEVMFAESTDMNEFLQKITFDWLGKVRKLASRRGLGVISNQNDVLPMLVRNPGYDKAVANFVRASRYPDYYNWDRSVNPYRYDAAVLLHQFGDRESFMHVCNAELPSLRADLRLRRNNFNAAQANMTALPNLEYLQIECILAKNLLDETLQREKTLLKASEALGCPILI